MPGKFLSSFFRLLFFASVLISAGFLSCLTAMRFAIRGNEVTVPNLIGKTVKEGNRLLSLSELQLKIESRRFDDQIQSDRIISQVPFADSKLKKNRSVRVVVSLGAKKVLIPDLRGESLRASQITLVKRGLALGLTSVVHAETSEKDRIISQDPLPQTKLAQSPLINVLVSSGKKSREYLMPELTGRNLQEVSKAFEGLGITLGRISYQAVPGLLNGTVLKQNPPPGCKLVEGDSIDLEICK